MDAENNDLPIPLDEIESVFVGSVETEEEQGDTTNERPNSEGNREADDEDFDEDETDYEREQPEAWFGLGTGRLYATRIQRTGHQPYTKSYEYIRSTFQKDNEGAARV